MLCHIEKDRGGKYNWKEASTNNHMDIISMRGLDVVRI